VRICSQLRATALAVAVLAAGMRAPARAHFILVAPEASKSQGPFGDPQKLGPCGEEGTATPTGVVTTFHPGDTIEVMVDEVIFHPGHYRVALAVNDRSELPPDPAVATVGKDPCGSTTIEDPPMLPVLADDMLPHTQPFDAPQTFTVTLPDDVTCTRCTLQIIEYMSNHGRPCFYHHCADIAIAGDAATPTATPAPSDIPSMTATATLTALTTAIATATATVSAPCDGDCDGNGSVTIGELITLVRIALEELPIATCAAGNPDGNLQLTIGEILTAVNRALIGCAPP